MYSCKLLKFRVLAISSAIHLPDRHVIEIDEARLLQVAMTQLTDKWVFQSHQKNDFIRSDRAKV